jgi:heme/copper-type cytochrome/quinol oxidase subunit 3
LLIRGVTATLAHQEILKGEQNIWIFASGGLGLYFLSLQGIEYYYSTFRISSRVYGSVFFFGTGFHGLHVCLGMIILMTSAFRVISNTMTNQHHFRLEFSLWYWHFVDVVWLFLFFWVYTWGC